MDQKFIQTWLRETDARRLESLWQQADKVRQANVGQEVHLRGLVEISNYCRRDCQYCGLRAGNAGLRRYRMSADEIIQAADKAVLLGYGTVVIQAGEDEGIGREWMCDIIRRIRQNTPLAVTLSLGERDDEDIVAWRQAGADRYLLRFETSNRELYRRIHPPRRGRASPFDDRVAMLRRLGELGYQVGSGVMVGIPGQTWDDLAGDVELFATLGLHMIGLGPFIPHPHTPLGALPRPDSADQVPADELTTYKMIALARLACPRANIPSTSALATLNRAEGRELGLSRGANVVMPNLTPVEYRQMYEIYPAKACIFETAEDCQACLTGRILRIGRLIGAGRGDCLAWQDPP